MAETSTSIEGLESQIPKKNRNPFQRWLSDFRGEAKIVEPKIETVQSMNNTETSIEQMEFYKAVVKNAELDELEISALAENADLISEKLKDSGGIVEAFKEMIYAAEEIQRAAEEVAANPGTVTPYSSETIRILKMLDDDRVSTDTQKSKIKSIRRLHVSTEEHTAAMKKLRGEWDVPLKNDAGLLFRVVLSEAGVRALEVDMRKGLEEVLEAEGEKVTTESLKAMQEICLEFKNSAVTIVSELKSQQTALERYEERFGRRFPDKTVEITAADYISKKKSEMTPVIEKGAVDVRDITMRVTDLANELQVGRMIRQEVLSQLGLKGERVDTGSVLEKYGEALADYEKSMEAAKDSLKKSDTNSATIMASYLALNRAVLAGSNIIIMEKSIREVLSAASVNEFALLSEKYLIAGEAKNKLAGEIARLQKRGLKEKALFEVAMIGKRMINAINKFVYWADSEVDSLEVDRLKAAEIELSRVEEGLARAEVDQENLANEILINRPIK
jgi:hypothetical protein